MKVGSATRRSSGHRSRLEAFRQKKGHNNVMKSNRLFAPLFFTGIAMILTSNAYPASASSQDVWVCSLLSVKTATAVLHAKVQPHPLEGSNCVWTTSWPLSQSGTGAGINVNVSVFHTDLAHVDQSIATFHGQRIQGLGQRAAWYPNPGVNVGKFAPVYSHLAVWQGISIITIQIGHNGEMSNDLEGYKIVAREILRRLYKTNPNRLR